MLTLYIVCGVVGLALAILIALGGEFGHHDFGVHIDGAHVDADSDGDGQPDGYWIPFLSLRFWTYFFAGFGATGFLLRQFASVDARAALMIALATGIVAGLSVAIAVRILKRSEATSAANSRDMLGIEATVMVAIRGGQPGRIRCKLKGEIIDFLAVSEEGLAFEAGEHVIVVGIENDRALVIPRTALFEESLPARSS